METGFSGLGPWITISHEFISELGIHGPKPYEIIWFGVVDVQFAYEFKGFGVMDG